jgi:hypothetical protein
LEIFAQAIEYRVAPTVDCLAFDDIASDLPVECDQLPVDGQRCSKLSGPDTLLEFAKERLVVLGCQFRL